MPGGSFTTRGPSRPKLRFLSVHVHRAIGREILWQRVGVEVAGYTLGGGGADVAFLEKR